MNKDLNIKLDKQSVVKFFSRYYSLIIFLLICAVVVYTGFRVKSSLVVTPDKAALEEQSKKIVRLELDEKTINLLNSLKPAPAEPIAPLPGNANPFRP